MKPARMDEKDSRDKQEKGLCWVCGAETKNRCGACEAAGFDLFCSKEHQKLVWFNHKRVCGSASNPFYWPSFNDDEIQLFHEVADKRRPQKDDEDLSLSSVLSFFLRLPRDQVIQRAPLLLKDPSLIDPRMRYEALILARSTIFELFTPPRYTYHFKTLNAFFHLAHLQVWLWWNAPHFSSLSTETRHRGLILFTLASYEAMEPPPPTYQRKFLSHAFTALIHSLVRGKRFPTPKDAHGFFKDMRNHLQPITALGFNYISNAITGEVYAFKAYDGKEGDEEEYQARIRKGDVEGFWL